MLENITQLLDNKNILILGFGKEGKSTLSFILDYCKPTSVTIADKTDVSASLPQQVLAKCGTGYMGELEKYDLIIKSPGIVYENQSEETISKTTSQTDLFLKAFGEQTVGITGTKGKSTTTTLIQHILVSAGISAVLTGNIGIPPLDSAREMTENSVAVFEMSCHQLEFQKISPHIAVLLNLYEDHLDHYGTRENYVKAKENIFLHQNKDDVFVVSSDCQEQIKRSNSRVITVGGINADCVVLGDKIEELRIPTEEISLVGAHNLFNIAIAREVTKLFDVSDTDFVNSLKTFKSLPHRLEYVCTKNGVEYYDDSISTVCQTTIQAILSLKNVQTVILGGMDRGIDYNELVDFLQANPIKNIVLAYESGKRISDMLTKKAVPHIFTQDLASAVKIAADVTEPGASCVLSPAAASYGYFKNFEERGEVFKSLVNKL